MTLTDQQYAALRELFHCCTDAFHALPDAYLDAYYKRLYAK